MATEAQLAERERAARESLAAAEQQLAELTAATQPSTDLDAELKRAAEVQVKETALRRVIAARRAELEAAVEAAKAAREPRLRAELAQERAAAAELLDELGHLLWEVYHRTDGVDAMADRIAAIKRELGAGYGAGDMMQLQSVRATVGAILEADLKVAVRVNGDRGLRLVPFDPAAKAERRAEDEKRIKATKERRKLEAMREGLNRLKSQVGD